MCELITPPGWQEVVQTVENSSFLWKWKQRKGVLSCVGFSIQDDCYLPTSNARLKFINDVATSPRTEISHIFWLLGVYTQEQLLSWKQLDGFNYYMRTVFSFGFGHPGKRRDSKWSPHILEYFDGTQFWHFTVQIHFFLLVLGTAGNQVLVIPKGDHYSHKHNSSLPPL